MISPSSKSISAADAVMKEAMLFDEYSVKTERVSTPSTLDTNARRKGNEGLTGAGFHNENGPNVQIVEEKSQHQIIAYLKAQGYINREIAKATGYTEAWLSQVTRQPWFKKRVASIIAENGGDPVKAFLTGEALPSLEALAEIRDDRNLPAAARVAATNAILDRAFGKPTQHIEANTTTTVKNAKNSADAIEQELNSINEQLKARGQPVSNHN
jgi:lambda repressor-like predicted transcriptional regulator